MATQKKIGGRGGVSEWRKLATAGDVRRFLAWTIHSMRNGTLEKGEAAIFSQLALALLKACESSEFEGRLLALEKTLEERHESISSSLTTH
jgi:hypothetical protein